MRRRHRTVHRRLTILLALISALTLFLAHRTWARRPTPNPVDLNTTELNP